MKHISYSGLFPIAAWFVGGCASSGAAGSETHFVCSSDAECRAGSMCVAGRCESTRSGENDSGAGGGGSETPGTGGGSGSGNGGSPVDDTGGSGAGGIAMDASTTPVATCKTSDDVSPLDDGCTEDVCHLAVRLDYATLTPRGYASVGGPAQSPDSSTALAAAQALFDAKLEYPPAPSNATIELDQAGVFRAYATPSDFGAFALIGARSGKVITAGSIIWSGTGHYAAPSSWKPASDIACRRGTDAGGRVTLEDSFFDGQGCSLDQHAGPTAHDALNLVLSTNLALHYAQRGPFTAFTYLYTPTVGTCDPTVAEYIVVLTSAPR